MDVVEAWTGRMACALQAALRMTNESFAGHLGVGVRTVASWHERPDLEPRPEMQQILDAALEKADAGAASRFRLIASGRTGQQPPGLELAVGMPGLPGPPLAPAGSEPTRRLLLAQALAGQDSLPGAALLQVAEAIRLEMEDTLASGTVPAARLARIEETIDAHLRLYTTTAPATALAGLLLDFMDVRRLSADRQPAAVQARLSEIATLLATLAADALMKLGRIAEARAWYGTAGVAADDSANTELRARVRAQEAMLPYYYGSPQEAVRLARQAQDVLGGRPRAAGALAAAAEARALARIGLRSDAETAMATARELAEKVHEPDNDEAFRFGERRLLFYLSGALTSLGETARAGRVQDQALGLYDSATPVIDPVLIRLDQAHLLIREGDTAGASELTSQACLSLAPEYRTRVLAARVTQMITTIPEGHLARRELSELQRALFPPDWLR
ncbi:MAG: hypothetical protein ACYCO9_21505 [Streptosporangiaceae bacterium]